MKCPKCSEEINELNHYQSGEAKYKFWIANGDRQYEEEDFQPDNQVTDYECPECNEVLFTNEEKAELFLKEKHDK